MTVGYEAYTTEKQTFLRKHGRKDWHVETSPMDQYGVYYKTYICGDGAIWYERMAPVWRTAKAEAEVEGIKIEIEKEVKLFETEFFNTDNATSKKYYEKF